MNSPLTTQIGGDHYFSQKIQPFEFSMANGWDSCAHTILKYVHRHAAKGGAQDLRKAIHTCEIRAELMLRFSPPLYNGYSHKGASRLSPRLSMSFYAFENAVPPEDSTALIGLERWVVDNNFGSTDWLLKSENCRNQIIHLLSYRYGEKA